MNHPSPFITMRLSNCRDRSVTFTANNSVQLEHQCRAARVSYRAQLASDPMFFAAQQQLNDLRHLLQPDLDGTNKPGKVAEWCARGHKPDAAEILWERLLDNRKSQLSAAKQRHKPYLMPDFLELHVDSVALPGKHWWNPANCVGGVRVHADMTLEALTHSGRKFWTWEQLWVAVTGIRQHELNLLSMGSWIRAEVEELSAVKPALTLVSSNNKTGEK